jgi:hypothetical protein
MTPGKPPKPGPPRAGGAPLFALSTALAHSGRIQQ